MNEVENVSSLEVASKLDKNEQEIKTEVEGGNTEEVIQMNNLSLANIKTNGFYGPLHPLQVGSWIVSLFTIIIYYTANIPVFSKDLKVINLCIYIYIV